MQAITDINFSIYLLDKPSIQEHILTIKKLWDRKLNPYALMAHYQAFENLTKAKFNLFKDAFVQMSYCEFFDFLFVSSKLKVIHAQLSYIKYMLYLLDFKL